MQPELEEPLHKAVSFLEKSARKHIPENPFIVAVKIDDVIVDFLLTLPGYEENIIHRAVNLDLGNIHVWFCSAEDLIIQKAVADRGKDWPDVESLLIDQWGNLDHQYIEDWLAQFSEALEQPEIFLNYQLMKKKVAQLFN